MEPGRLTIKFFLTCIVLFIGLLTYFAGCSSRQAAPQLSEQDKQQVKDMLAQLTLPEDTGYQRETQAFAQLKSTGLPVQAVYIDIADGGKKVLLVVVEYSKLQVGTSPGAFIVAGIESLIKVAGDKALDLSGISDITIALRDGKGRTILACCAAAKDADAFRNKKLTQAQFVKKIAFKVEDRFAALDAKNRKSQ